MRRTVFILVTFAAGAAVLTLSAYSGELRSAFSSYMRGISAKRQAERICLARERGEATLHELCTLPLPEVPALRSYFQRLS